MLNHEQMKSKPRSPADLAIPKPEKKTYSFSLLVSNMEEVENLVEEANKGRATSKVLISHVIDEAITHYLRSMKSHTSSKKK